MSPSVDRATDGADYIEGGGGNDVIFGNQGQDDVIGGNSDLFGLGGACTAANEVGGAAGTCLRPDGSDLIFGGSGTALDRLGNGDVALGGNANDSDAIVGDNGDIIRLVGTNHTYGLSAGGVQVSTTGFLEFNYDLYRALPGATPPVTIVARSIKLIDYTPGGASYNPLALNDIGTGDEIHGENGDDFIYGQVGNDVLYGEGQNDTMVGGYGSDWISGGTGDDGILGDDGRIYASRVSSLYGEPLNAVAAIDPSQISLLITTPGDAQEAVINPDGALKYTADLTPDNLDPAGLTGGFQDPYYRPPLGVANDVIYGGLGNDSIHGGAGDDAISGAEAPIQSYTNNYDQNGILLQADLRSDYYHPLDPGNVLGYDPTTGKRTGTTFALYDANDPLREILLTPGTGTLYKGPIDPSLQNSSTLGYHDWLLNFDYTEGPLDSHWFVGSAYPAVPTDGNDMIFGDLQNDWVVGGTGRDIAFLGWGDDQANMDDRLNTDNGLNDVPDTNPSYEDFVYGGAGRDVLIANTGGDRLVDWVGEFNTYLVPFAPFGEPTVSRTLQPQLDVFLLLLSQSAGSDLTLAAQHGGDPTRNGEPFGELGEVRQHDKPYWQDETGGPRDPQAGNIPGGSRDVRVTSGTQAIQSPGTQGLATLPSPAIKLPAHVGSGNPILVPVQVTGPATSTALVSVTDGVHTVSGTGTIGAGGMLQLNFDLSSLNDGPITITLILVDAQGHQSAPVVTTSIKDSSAPVAPTTTAPAAVGLADLATFTITISGEIGSFANWSVTDGITVLGESDPLDATGHLTVTVDVSSLLDGVLTTSVSLTDLAGNTSAASTSTTTKSTGAAGTAGVTVAASSPNGAEQGLVPVVFTIVRSGVTTSAITINLGWSGGATLNTDYHLTATGGTLGVGGSTLTLAAGVTSATITATPVDDTLIELTESVVLTLLPQNGAPGSPYSVGTPSVATGSIADNDTPVITIAATDATGAEASQNPIVFTVSRTVNNTVSTAVTLSWSGTADMTVDYTVTVSGGTLSAGNTLLTLAAGSSSATITVKPVDDSIIEPTDTVTLSLVGGTNYTLGTPTFATGTIVDNDTPVITVAATDASGAEQAQDPIVFTVTRTANTTVSTVVNLTWGGTATFVVRLHAHRLRGRDAGSRRLDPDAQPGHGERDDHREAGRRHDGRGRRDRDADDRNRHELHAGRAGDRDRHDRRQRRPGDASPRPTPSGAEQGQDPIVFTVTRSNYLTGNITVNLAWSGTATLGTDYTLSSSGGTLSANGLTLTMFNGDTSYTITAKPVDDAIIEPSETVVLTLSSGTGYSAAAPGTATGSIADNDTGVVSVAATDASGAEQAQDPIVFTVTRTVSTSAAITVNLTWTGSATITSDYTLTAVGGTLGAGGTTLTLAAGVSSATITAKPVDDSIIETAETVTVTVGTGTGYTPGAALSATGSIADNDTPVVVVAATDATGSEQLQDPIVFTVTRTVNSTCQQHGQPDVGWDSDNHGRLHAHRVRRRDPVGRRADPDPQPGNDERDDHREARRRLDRRAGGDGDTDARRRHERRRRGRLVRHGHDRRQRIQHLRRQRLRHRAGSQQDHVDRRARDPLERLDRHDHGHRDDGFRFGSRRQRLHSRRRRC